jgi:predicted ribosomally synthesized peptide with nif11-like leader
MSQEQLKAFLEKVKSDPSLQQKLKADGADPIAIAKAEGFKIDSIPTELSDEELEGVSGGTICWWNATGTILIGPAAK